MVKRQRRLWRQLASGSLLLAATVSHSVYAQTAPSAAEASTLQAADATYRRLADAQDGNVNDIAYNYALGIAAIDAGHLPEAILALQRVLALDPAHAQARAEIARAYALAGDIDTARAQFDTVLQDPSLPDPVRQRFNTLVAGFDRQIGGKGKSLTGFAEISGGIDSNINSATDLTSVTIPIFAVFGPGALSGNARQIDDAFLDVSGGVSLVSGISRGNRVFVSVLGDYRGNQDNRAFNQGSVSGTLGSAHTLANQDTISVAAQGQQFWLGDQSYRQTIGGVLQYTHPLPGGRAISLSGQYARTLYVGQPLYDAHHFAASATYATRHVVASLDGGYEATSSQSTQSNYFADASLSGQFRLARGLDLVGALSGGLRAYDKQDLLFLVKREDKRIDASIGLRMGLLPHLSVRPRLTYTRNFSNVVLYDTQRWTGSIAARVEF